MMEGETSLSLDGVLPRPSYLDRLFLSSANKEVVLIA